MIKRTMVSSRKIIGAGPLTDLLCIYMEIFTNIYFLCISHFKVRKRTKVSLNEINDLFFALFHSVLM